MLTQTLNEGKVNVVSEVRMPNLDKLLSMFEKSGAPVKTAPK